MKINVHIERLVLEDIDITPDQQRFLQTSLATELAQELTNIGLAPRFIESISLARLSTNSIQLTDQKLTNQSSIQLGQQIAQSVFGGVARE